MKLHVRWALKRGQRLRPRLTHGRISDRSSPFKETPLPVGSLYIADLGYLDWGCIAARRAAGSYTARPRPSQNPLLDARRASHCSWTLCFRELVGQTKELWVRVGDEHRHLMRLLILRVVSRSSEASTRRPGGGFQATRSTSAGESLETGRLDHLAHGCPCEPSELAGSSCLISRERWQMEMLDKLWKHYGCIDEWRTTNSWRVLCELYAKLIGLLPQHWLMILFAGLDEQRSLVKLAQVGRDTASSLLEALAGNRSLLSALECIQRRMRSGCQMNKRKKHPNSAQLLQCGSTNWVLSP